MMRRDGFSFIEIIVAVLISSLLSLVLYRSLSQTQKTVQRISSLIDETNDLLPLSTQLEKDFAGSLALDSKPTGTGNERAQKKEQSNDKKEKKKLFFVGTTKDGNLDTLHCVTTSLVAAYDEVAPLLASVTYRLERQQDATVPSFLLVREEAPYQSDASNKGGKEKKTAAGKTYVLMYDIIKLSVTYIAPLTSKQEAQGAEAAASYPEWNAAIVEKTKARLPSELVIKGVRLVGARREAQEFLFTCVLPTAAAFVEQAPEKTKSQEAATLQQSTQQGPQKQAAPQTETMTITILQGPKK